MEQKQEHLKNLAEIRSLMEKSSRFISLSGLSGISAGVIALIGAAIAFLYLNYDTRYTDFDSYMKMVAARDVNQVTNTLIVLSMVILVLAISAGIFFTTRKALKNKQKIWDKTTRRLLFHVAIPLATGGIFCFVLLQHRVYLLIAPASLIFYGLALLNGSKFTLNDIQYLGISEIVLGLISSVMVGYGLIFWAIGFGVLHIIYGWIMYHKYERKNNAR